MIKRIIVCFVLTGIVVLLSHDLPLAIQLSNSDRDATWVGLRHDAALLGQQAEETLEGRAADDLNTIAADYRAETGNDAIIISTAGEPVGVAVDARADVTEIAGRDEVRTALASQPTYSSFTSGGDRKVHAVTVPVLSGTQIRGAVYVATPSSRLSSAARKRLLGLLMTGIVTLAAVSLIGLLVARWLTRPLRGLLVATQSFADGDVQATAPDDNGPPEIRGLASAFNSMTMRIRAAFESQAGFAADASHQLRTPLTALRLRLEQLDRHVAGADDGPGHQILAAAHDETDRLHRMIEGLLALARADANTTAVVVDASAIIEARLDLWAPLATERDVAMTIDVPPGLGAYAVAGAVEQIIDNYVANAIEVAPSQSIISITGRRVDAGRVELRVTDRGPGMHPEQLAHAFDRFWRAPGATQGGTGLGLSIVARLAHASGGSVELRNAPIGGLEAIVRLRAAQALPPPPS